MRSVTARRIFHTISECTCQSTRASLGKTSAPFLLSVCLSTVIFLPIVMMAIQFPVMSNEYTSVTCSEEGRCVPLTCDVHSN